MAVEPEGPPFAPADRPARWTKGLLLSTLVIAVAAVISGLSQLGLLARVTSGSISAEEVAANDLRQQLIGVLQSLIYLGTAVAFLTWFHRAHKNLPALGGRGLKYTPGWAVGGFFVPFLGLVRPLQVMREVWHGSDPSGLERDAGSSGPIIRNQLGTPSLVSWWWALFLTSSILGSLAFRLSRRENQSLGQIQALSVLLVISDVLDLPAALVANRLVGRITAWQAQRQQRIHQLAAEALPDSVENP